MSDKQDYKKTLRMPGPCEKLVTVNILAEEETPVFRYRLLATPNKQKAYLECQVLSPDGLPGLERLERLLHENGIQHGIERSSLHQLLLRVEKTKKTVGPLQVASGTLPEIGEDGYIDWFILPSATKARYTTDDKGNIDYHQTNLIDNALKGATIARLCAPTQGKPGKDIFGISVETTSGKPFTIRLGVNVTLNEKDNLLTATRDGRVVFDGERISIDPTYIISGDIDLSVGNIDFVGSVEVHGDVQDNFTIQAREGITIHGNVGACQLASNADITIRGGVSGKSRARITSETGTITAKYINEAVVETHGSIIVRNEIVNSTLRSSQSISIPLGSIIGGSCSALQGIEAKVLGSSLGVITRLASGMDWTAESRLVAAETCIQHYDLCFERLKGALAPILKEKSLSLLCTTIQRELLKEVLIQCKDLYSLRKTAIQERTEIRSCIRDDAIFQINCINTVFTGVMIELGTIMGQIRAPIQGPVSIIQNKKTETIASSVFVKLIPPSSPGTVAMDMKE